ncbi:protein of unknown function DUF4326 [Vibrio phage 1.031.O._10N.261.46.F8]|nr:protein of unknown function DUF4326 [Vibrio phage 1.031.O._10N.261.46.F8]
MSKRLVVHSAFESYDVLIDRTTIWGNRYYEFGATNHDPVEKKVHVHMDQIKADLTSGKITLWDLLSLRGKVLGCWCCTPNKPDATCHGWNLVSMSEWAYQQLFSNDMINIEGQRRIKQFNDEYRFLSNFWHSDAELQYAGLNSHYTECIYQAFKFHHDYSEEGQYCDQAALEAHEIRDEILTLPPGAAKKLAAANKLMIRPDWQDVNLQCMYAINKQKYLLNTNLKKQLLDTGDAYLEEGNRWGDKFYGVCLKTGKGENHLGQILMRIRDELRSA